MASYFEDKLLELLPSLYLQQDKDGELRQFLKIPAETLDELKALMDQFPTLFDVDRCDERFLLFLGNIVGYRYDPVKNAHLQRRLIKEAIPFYRRKATIPALDRSLTDIGWQGRIKETYRKALRLNRRSVVGKSRLPGKIYSLGVFRIESDNVIHGIREALIPHHPAGTKAYYLQWLYSMLSMENCFDTTMKQFVQTICFGHLNEAFVVGRRKLNRDWHLTQKRKSWCTWVITNSVTMFQDIERAGVCIFRWQKRRPGFHLNAHKLNTMLLVNVWNNEKKQIMSCEIEISRDFHSKRNIKLKDGKLNKNRIGHSKPACHVIFRQKDFITMVSIIPENKEPKTVFVLFYTNAIDLAMQAWGLHQQIV